jgi:hypothetical protein
VDGLGDAAASLYITTQQLFLLGGSICLLGMYLVAAWFLVYHFMFAH